MATLWVTEYADISAMANGPAQVGKEPAVADQSVTFTSATASSAFNTKTRLVRLYASAACHVHFATAPTATAAKQKLAADTEYWRGVTPGQKVSVYDGSS